MHDAATDATAPPAPQVAASPFAGFIPRAAALAIDLVLIHFVGYTLDLAFRARLLELGAVTPFVGSVGAFAYFCLANGPAGRGATLGKAILNLRVVDRTGRPLGWGASFRRAVLQFPMIFTILLALAADFVRGAIVPLFAIVSIVRVVGEVIFLGHAFCIATHPMRRGWHDLWADSFVAPEPLPNAFAEAVSAESEPAVAARVRSGRRTSLGFAAFLLVLMLAQQVVGLFDPEARAKLADWVEIGDELVEGYSLDGLEFRFADAATTATLATAAAEEYVATFRFTRQRGPVRAEEMDDPTIRRQVEALLGDPGKAYAASPNALDIPIARVRRFRAQFTDRLDIVLFLYSSVGDRFWIAERPAAPGDGPIEYRWIDVEDAEHPPGSN